VITSDRDLAAAASRVRSGSNGAADSLEIKVVIPDISEDRTNRIVITAGIAIKGYQNSFVARFSLEV
jgi:hypothetical protein